MQISSLKHYPQIKPEEFVPLAVFHLQKFIVPEIVRILLYVPCTITRELNRNSVRGHFVSKPEVV